MGSAGVAGVAAAAMGSAGVAGVAAAAMGSAGVAGAPAPRWTCSENDGVSIVSSSSCDSSMIRRISLTSSSVSAKLSPSAA